MRSLYLLCLIFWGLCLQAQTKDNSASTQDSLTTLEMEIPTARGNLTITESAQIESISEQDIGANYDFGEIGEALSGKLENDEAAHSRSGYTNARIHLRDVLIGFILEIVLTMVVLAIAFSLIGFPFLVYQIGLLSLAMALSGAALHYLLFIGLFNPIRIGLSFVILLILIKQFTDVRGWATAIRIAILVRLISLGLMWLALAGTMAIFGL